SSCRPSRAPQPEVFGRGPKTSGSRNASYFAGVAFAEIGHGCICYAIELTALRVALDFLIETHSIELLEPGAEALQFTPGELGDGFFNIFDGHERHPSIILVLIVSTSRAGARHRPYSLCGPRAGPSPRMTRGLPLFP